MSLLGQGVNTFRPCKKIDRTYLSQLHHSNKNDSLSVCFHLSIWIYSNLCEDSNPNPEFPQEEANSNLLHLCIFSPLYVFKCVLNLVTSDYMHSHIGCICLTFLLKLSAREEAKSHWLHSFNFSTVCYQTSPKMLCRSGCIITRVTFVWLFFTVCFQISPQISCLIGYKITLSAFVWLPHCVLSNES